MHFTFRFSVVTHVLEEPEKFASRTDQKRIYEKSFRLANEVAKLLDVTVCKDVFLEKLPQSFGRIQILRIGRKLELHSFYNEIRTYSF